MARNDTVSYEEIMNIISKHQEICFTCSNYITRQCGFAFPGARISEDQFPPDGEIQNWAYDTYQLFLTQSTGEACEKQTHSIVFLNLIEDKLSKTPPGIDEDTVNYILQRAFRILNKYSHDEGLYKNTPIKDDIQKAINLVMAHIDLDSLEHGANIYQLIQSVEIGYDRTTGLFRIYPKAMAIALMRRCVQQTPDGYYLITGDFDDTLNDFRINKANFVGRNWLEMEKRTGRVDSYDRSADAQSFEEKEIIEEPDSEVLRRVPELKQLIAAGILSNSLQLLSGQSRRAIVEYCYTNNLFKPWHLADWKAIGGIISDRQGRKISASSLKQAYQDYQKNCL